MHKYVLKSLLKYKTLDETVTLLLYIVAMILIFFIKIFINYSSILLGSKKTNIELKALFIYIIIFIVTLMISAIVLGIPRLYFVWICLFLYKIYRINKDPLFIQTHKKNLISYLGFEVNHNIIPYLINDYKYINKKGFSFSFMEYLNIISVHRYFIE